MNSLFDVYEAFNLEGNKVIVKIASDSNLLSKILINEYAQLKRLNHNFIPKVVEIIESKILILKFIPGENLKDVRIKNKLKWSEIRNIFLQLLEIISYLHENGVIHGDIKPENLIYDGVNLFLIDFGSAIKIGEKITILQYTPGFCIPNSHRVKRDDKKIDYYCLFRVFLYLLRGDRKILFEDLPLKLEKFIKIGLKKKMYEPEKILNLWDYFEI